MNGIEVGLSLGANLDDKLANLLSLLSQGSRP